MQTGFRIVNQTPLDENLLKALLMLLSLKSIAKGLVIGSLLTIALALYSLVASALCEITTSIASLWVTSDSITRLLLLCLAVYCIKKAFPYIVTLHRKGVL